MKAVECLARVKESLLAACKMIQENEAIIVAEMSLDTATATDLDDHAGCLFSILESFVLHKSK